MLPLDNLNDTEISNNYRVLLAERDRLLAENQILKLQHKQKSQKITELTAGGDIIIGQNMGCVINNYGGVARSHEITDNINQFIYVALIWYRYRANINLRNIVTSNEIGSSFFKKNLTVLDEVTICNILSFLKVSSPDKDRDRKYHLARFIFSKNHQINDFIRKNSLFKIRENCKHLLHESGRFSIITLSLFVQGLLNKASVTCNTSDEVVNVKYNSRELAKMFVDNTKKTNLFNNEKEVIIIFGTSGEDDKYIINLTSSEYVTIMNDNDAYVKLVGRQFRQPSIKP